MPYKEAYFSKVIYRIAWCEAALVEHQEDEIVHTLVVGALGWWVWPSVPYNKVVGRVPLSRLQPSMYF